MPSIYFNGPVGRIQGRYHQHESKTAPIALVLHPDPLQGGTMNNKVTYTLFKAFVAAGYSVLRINFPGVSGSAGTLANGDDEFRVAAHSLDWMKYTNPDAMSVSIAGFSFGSKIALQVASRRPEIETFVAVAPPVKTFDFSFFSPAPLPGLVIAGSLDEISPVDRVSTAVREWSKRKEYSSTLHIIPNADHYFESHLDEVFDVVLDYLNTSLAMRVVKPVKKKRRRRKKRDRGYDEMDD